MQGLWLYVHQVVVQAWWRKECFHLNAMCSIPQGPCRTKTLQIVNHYRDSNSLPQYPEAAKYTKFDEVRGLKVFFSWRFLANPDITSKGSKMLESPRETDFQTPIFIKLSVFSSLRVAIRYRDRNLDAVFSWESGRQRIGTVVKHYDFQRHSVLSIPKAPVATCLTEEWRSRFSKICGFLRKSAFWALSLSH